VDDELDVADLFRQGFRREARQGTYLMLAIYELFSGRHEEARRRLGRALDLNPNSVFARGYLGVSYAFAGDCEATFANADENGIPAKWAVFQPFKSLNRGRSPDRSVRARE